METSPHLGQIATFGLPILPPNSLFSSDDITIPYPAPSTLMAQFSFISVPHLRHFLINKSSVSFLWISGGKTAPLCSQPKGFRRKAVYQNAGDNTVKHTENNR